MPLDHILERLEIIIIEEDLPLRKSRLDSFFERIDYVNFLAGGYENERDLRVAKHVQDFVEHVLLAPFNIEVDILKNKKNA